MNEENKDLEETKETKEENAIKKLLSPMLEDGKPSVGRIMLISTFILAMIVWIKGDEIPQTMLTVLLGLIAYIVGSKALGTTKEVMKKFSDTKTIVAKMKK